MRLSYIVCNSCIVSLAFLNEVCSNELYCCNDSSMFRSVVAGYCCSDSVIVKLFCCDCCSDSFVGKLTNFNSSILLVFRFEEKKLLFFFNLLECLPCGWMTGDLFTWIHRLVTGSP